jgi:uncharacterized membrane protein YfcA
VTGLTEFGLGFMTSALGAVGGLGGAVILVPLLVLTGTTSRVAAPLGLVSVAAGSLAAGTHQLEERAVNHRLGIVTEIMASLAAVLGALVSASVSERMLNLVLGLVAMAAAVFGGRRKGMRNLPDPELGPADVGEHVGALSGVYRFGDRFVPYRAQRVGLGLGLFAIAGLLAGLAGTGGGFIKTPATSEVMRVPVRVAAATTTFTIGITSAAGLLVFAVGGRLEMRAAAAVCAGSILGGAVGARLQARLSPMQVRRALSVLLLVVGALLVVRR